MPLQKKKKNENTYPLLYKYLQILVNKRTQNIENYLEVTTDYH